MRAPDPHTSAASTSPFRRALRWILLLGLAGYCSIRPAPLPLDVLYGSNRASGPTSPPGAASAATSGQDAPQAALRAVDWGLLGQLDYRSTTVAPALARVNGTRVRIPGFIVPLEDFQESATEFLLVPYFGACVHMPPPPPNQMVYVRFAGGAQSLSLFDPVWVEGTLEVQTIESPFGSVSYTMRGQRIEPYQDER
jgi:uncharacterized protein